MIEIVIGPPGTGKTTYLLDIVDKELERGTAPDRIGYFSFTKRATLEAVTRAGQNFNLKPDALPHFRTLHSHCYRYLGLRKQDVFENSKVQEFAREASVRVTGRWTEDGTLSGFQEGDRIMFMENLARVRCIPLRLQYLKDDDNLPWDRVERAVKILNSFKTRNGLMDYTDMLSEYIRSGGRPRLEVLIIDEVQDLSQLQWRVVHELMKGCRRVIVAGDDDQAIYPWAGADVAHFVALEGDINTLGQSWRVPRQVQRIADWIIKRVRGRRAKQWSARNVEGEVRRANSVGEINYGSDKTMVLARNSYVLKDQVFPELRRTGVIYEYNGRSSIRNSVKDAVVWWERLRRGEEITVDEAKSIYSFISSGVGVLHGFKQLPKMREEEFVSMTRLRSEGGLLADGPWYEALDRLPSDERAYIRTVLEHGNKLSGEAQVTVSTIHGSKGGQADHVVVMQEMAKRTFKEYEDNPDDEARVWYVAVTRSKQKLTLVNSSTGHAYPI